MCILCMIIRPPVSTNCLLNLLCCLQFLGVSIWTYKGPGDRSVAQMVTQVVSHPAEEAASWGAVWLPILMMYSPVQIVCTVFSLSFMLAPPSFAAAFWVGFMSLYYAITLPGAPEHTGQPSPALIVTTFAQIGSLVDF